MTEPYYDHAQSPRLGQPTPVENPGVQLHTIETSPEVAYRGQIIYLIDIDQFRVFDGVAWQIPSGSSNAAGLQMFVGSTAPVADATGDLWMNNATNQLSVWDGTVWRPTVDPAAAAANTAASNAMAAALQAQDSAALAKAAADGKITTYYSSTQPTTGSLGDLWINTVTNRLYRYNGGWGTEIKDVGIVQALNAAGTAQSTADGAIRSWFGTPAPTLGPLDVGDLWFDTVSSNEPKRWTGTAFESVRDATIATAAAAAASAATSATNALTAAQKARAIADGTVVAYYQPTAPWAIGTIKPDVNTGDLWYNTTSKIAYRWVGNPTNLWAQDNAATISLSKAQTAQSTADGKIVSYYAASDSPPTGVAVGDVWFVSDLDNLVRFWNGTAWTDLAVGTDGIDGDYQYSGEVQPQQLQTGSITEEITVTGKLTVGDASGQRGEWGSSGLVIFDSNGEIMISLPAFVYDPDNPTQKQDAQFKGTADFGTMTTSGLTITAPDPGDTFTKSTIESEARLVVNTGISASTSPPAMAVDYQTTGFKNPALGLDVCWSWASSLTLDAYITRNVDISTLWVVTSGVHDSYVIPSFAAHGVIPHHSGSGWVVAGTIVGGANNKKWQARHYTIVGGALNLVSQSAAGFFTPINPWKLAVGTQSNVPGYLIIASVNNARQPTVRRFWTDGVAGQTAWSLDVTDALSPLPANADGVYDLGSVEIGTFDEVQGSSNYLVYLSHRNNMYCFDNTATPFPRYTQYEFPLNNEVIAHAHKLTATDTYSFVGWRGLSAKADIITQYSTANMWTATNDKYWWGAYAWFNGSSHTAIGQKAMIKMTKRARLVMTSPTIPVGSGGASNPNAVRFFMGKGLSSPSNSAMWQQTDAVDTDTTVKVQTSIFTGGSTVASVCPTNNFVAGSAVGGGISSGALWNGVNPMWILTGDGAGKIGPYSWDKNGKTLDVFCARSTATVQTTSSSTYRAVVFAGTPVMNSGDITTDNTVFTIGNAGLYALSSVLQWDNVVGTTARRLSQIESFVAQAVGTGTIMCRDERVGSGPLVSSMNYTEQYLTAGTKLRVITWQNSGSNIDIKCDTQLAQFNIRKVG